MQTGNQNNILVGLNPPSCPCTAAPAQGPVLFIVPGPELALDGLVSLINSLLHVVHQSVVKLEVLLVLPSRTKKFGKSSRSGWNVTLTEVPNS